MTVSRRTSLPRLINRLLQLPPCESTKVTEGNFNILGETIDADAFATMRVYPEKDEARILGGSGLYTPVDKWDGQLKTPCLAEQAAKIPITSAVTGEGPLSDDPFLKREGVHSMLVQPLTVGDVCVVTTAFRRSPGKFKPGEIQRFTAVAGVINMAWACCHLLEEHGALRGTDKLTGLGLFSDFHETMVKELSRARRGGGTVTMGIMSVESQGSVPMEETLLDVTRTFQEQLRNFDTLDRYGSRELAFILPDLRSAEGVRVVDRVMGEILSSLGGEGNAPDIYVGLSCYPEDGATVERLIETAEAAMNQALEESRPGVHRWEE